MRRLISLILMISLIIGVASSCGRTVTVQKIAPPPLPERPTLTSICKDKNDETGEQGFWLDLLDLKKLTKYAESIEAVRQLWGKPTGP